jgi:integrase
MREDAGTEDLTWENYRREQGCALTREELGRFLAAAKELSPHGWYAFCVLGFGSDARFSELAAAQIQDFNLKDDVGIWLCRRHLISSRAEVAGGIKWNRKGIVRLLDAETTRILRPYLVGKEPEDLLFPSDQSGCTFRSNKGLQWFLDLVSKKAELPRMTSKVFRRTFLTLSHLDTMASAVSQAQAGHSDAKTTMTYVKPSLDARKEHARRMGGVLYAVKTDDPTDA